MGWFTEPNERQSQAMEGTWFTKTPFDVVDAAIMKTLQSDPVIYFTREKVTDAYSRYARFGYGTTELGKRFVTAILVRKLEVGTEITIQGPFKPFMIVPRDDKGNPIVLPEIEQDREGLEGLTPSQRDEIIWLKRCNRSKVPDPNDLRWYEYASGFQGGLIGKLFEALGHEIIFEVVRPGQVQVGIGAPPNSAASEQPEASNPDSDGGLLKEGKEKEHLLFGRRSVFVIIIALVALAVIVVEIGSVFIPAVPLQWDWLNQHPNRLGLIVSTALIFVGTGWAVTDEKHRWIAAIPLLIAVVVAVVPILGK